MRFDYLKGSSNQEVLMTRILLTAATLIGLTTGAFAQSYNSPPRSSWWQSYFNRQAMVYGNPYDKPSPSTGD